jgi:hypothetical protein
MLLFVFLKSLCNLKTLQYVLEWNEQVLQVPYITLFPQKYRDVNNETLCRSFTINNNPLAISSGFFDRNFNGHRS